MQWSAIVISVVLAVWCAWIIVYNYQKHHRPLCGALKSRIIVLEAVLDAEETDEAQRLFADRFEDIDAVLRSGGKPAHEMCLAWAEFRETIVDDTATPRQATSRADAYFLHLGDDTRVLAWWANIFVALGLTCTFLGIVAALTITVAALDSAGGTGSMTPALIRLLEITSVKFWTSIAGVVCSIVLRTFDRRWHSKTQRELERVVDGIDRGTQLLPPQRIAAEQLVEMKEQTAALKAFSTEFAIAIQDALSGQMQPMVGALAGIQTSIDDFKDGSFNQIGRELGEALSRNAGTEMQQLGVALADMTHKIASIHDGIETSGNDANERIAAAARDFSAASERMQETFSALNERIGKTGSRLTESADAASASAVAQFDSATEGLQQAFDQVRGEIADLGQHLTTSAGATADRNAEVLARAADALEQATTRTSEGMGRAIDQAVSRAGEESARAMSVAFASFGSRFEEASVGLVDTLRSTAGRMEILAGSIERSAAASETHVTSLVTAADRTDGLSTNLARAAHDLEAAAEPIRTATEAIGGAVGRIQIALERQAETADRNEASMTAISEKLAETSEAATRAWAEYRSRFEEVDKALAATLDQIKSAAGEHALHLNEQVGRVDKALADAIDKLAAGLDPLRDLADQIEDLIGKLQVGA